MINNLNKNTKIYIAGHNGLIGSSFVRFFKNNGFKNIIVKDRSQLDLKSSVDTENFFHKYKPEIVILAAGMVGGIIQNRDNPADFIFENLSIQLNVIKAAYKINVDKLLFFASSCMYPKNTKQPMKESQLWTGHLEETSIAYASAKYAGVQMCKSINKQNGSANFIPVIPNSAYGPNDNFDLNSSHVLAALISRMHEAKEKNSNEVLLWGSGSPKREFIFVDDIVNACINIIDSKVDDDMLPINIGVGVDISIKELAKKIAKIIGYSGEILWDESKPDGSARKLLDNSRIKSLGWGHEVDLDHGISITYKWYLDNMR